jgi:hypothetical protein
VPAYFFNTSDGEGPRALAIDISYIEPASMASDPATDPGAVDGGSGKGSGGQPGSIEPSAAVPAPATAKSGG